MDLKADSEDADLIRRGRALHKLRKHVTPAFQPRLWDA